MAKMNTTHYLFLPLFFLSQLVSHSAQESTEEQKCQHFPCRGLGPIGYPFFRIDGPKCGIIAIDCSKSEPKVQFREKKKWYRVKEINYLGKRMIVSDEVAQSHLASNNCDLLGYFPEREHLNNYTQQVPHPVSFNVFGDRQVFKCKHKPNFRSTAFNQFRNYSCKDYDLYYEKQGKNISSLPDGLSNSCSVVHLMDPKISGNLSELNYNFISEWGATFIINWTVPQACGDCSADGEECSSTSNKDFSCGKKGKKLGVKVAAGFGGAAGALLLTVAVLLIYRCYKRNRLSSSSALISRDLSRDNSLKPDPEKGSLFFETKLFTYKELDEATNHFDSNKELGDGGFGTVYFGKLRDGRVVAVKRLFEHNYKRVEQFMNEIEILSRLRHQNLVSLYGCTSRHSRELLLVYEFVPNGTVADHLHGERAKEGLLTWPIRMSIAIQSADALAYLHASEIIHRDVKTNNILLDNSFHVKVADFGLSRLFPTDVTHVSTAPQGTPGYVDPEYYHCYQLTSKSDVYSFGVVLIELISSKPAVDIGRHRHEINLASLAVNKIHNQALHELVDSSLGYDTDYSVRNMITLVAELAFRCLQQENEMRPCMTEVLEILRGIENEEYKKTKTDDMDTSAVARLLKKSEPLSPDTVTGKWPSKDSTPNVSG